MGTLYAILGILGLYVLVRGIWNGVENDVFGMRVMEGRYGKYTYRVRLQVSEFDKDTVFHYVIVYRPLGRPFVQLFYTLRKNKPFTVTDIHELIDKKQGTKERKRVKEQTALDKARKHYHK